MLQISQKTFLLAGLVLFLLASAVLFTLHDRALDPNQTGNWWAVRFVDPSDPTSLAFEIENHADTTSGQYEIYTDGILKAKEEIVLTAPVSRFVPTVTRQPTQQIRIVIKLGNKEKTLTR